ncbi:hypothetical protein COV93_03905 [Candidatus Woesearchaeota archaeon CG11_big_fil_rev_8_21_14_0_20_43_8]|nr:MAG: hypothetical protein COV93_03905 [Candidatus Woesearchaeota archaeon CG11_big_fil_rev_8_21_14_0_20_43_8]
MKRPKLLGIDRNTLAGIKDYYETTMADTNVFTGVSGRGSVFNLACRGLRKHKIVGEESFAKDGKDYICYEVEKHNYLLNAGLEQAVACILGWEMNDGLLSMYKRKGLNETLIDSLSSDRILDLSVYAIPEGIPIYGHEPQISVHGTFERVQFPESLLLGVIGYQTAVATYASYVRNITRGKKIMLLEGGSRRVYPGSAVAASRAALIGGFNGTSNEQLGIEYPELISAIGGSAGHSSVLHAGSDENAFERQVKAYYAIKEGDDTSSIEEKVRKLEKKGFGPTFLIDTFDSGSGIETAIEVFKRYGIRLGQVRNDSGDPLERSRHIRRRLDESGLSDVRIMVSDDLTPAKINQLLLDDAPIDTILMGTYLVNPFKLPGPVYKMAHDDAWGYVCKVSANNPTKSTLPGRLDVYRVIGPGGYAERDVILMRGIDEICDHISPGEDAELLTKKVIEHGRQIYDFPSMTEIMATRERFLSIMKEEHIRFTGAEEYPVVVSGTVTKAKEEFSKRFLRG